MPLLLAVSAVWAISFGLIKTRLTGVHPDVVNAARLGLALVVFLPSLRLRAAGARRALELAAIGALQFGLMYFLYTRSYRALAAHQVALATVMTPIYVALVDDLLERRLRPRFLAAAALAALGTGVSVSGDGAGRATVAGIALVQSANLCFAVGQVWYRRALARPGAGPLRDRAAFAWSALGAAAFAALAAAPSFSAAAWAALTARQLATLAYLGLVASGLCFFLWNVGARRVNTGVLAVMNDLKIPLGVVASVAFFGERADWARLLAGGALIALGWWWASRADRGPALARARLT